MFNEYSYSIERKLKIDEGDFFNFMEMLHSGCVDLFILSLRPDHAGKVVRYLLYVIV